jgi:hypothetical protein
MLSHCNCLPKIIVKKEPCKGCLYTDYLYYPCATSVKSCGDVLVTNLKKLVKNCGSTPSFILVSSGFNQTEISGDGILTVTTDSTHIPNNVYDIVYKVVCGDKTTFGFVKICINDPCQFKDCGCDYCDPCTGECGDPQSDLKIEGEIIQSNPTDISIL